jgi:hypothetical protein
VLGVRKMLVEHPVLRQTSGVTRRLEPNGDEEALVGRLSAAADIVTTRLPIHVSQSPVHLDS